MGRRILDLFRGKTNNVPDKDLKSETSPTLSGVPQLVEEHAKGGKDQKHTDIYFKEMTALQEAVSKREYEKARRHALEALPHIGGFVDEWLRNGYPFSVDSIPPLEVGGLMFALLNDRDGIERIKNVAVSREQLEKWRSIHVEHEESRTLFRAIENVVATRPGVLQNSLKNEVGTADGRRVSTLVGWLEKANRIRREPSGNTYALFPLTKQEASQVSSKPNTRKVGSHRRGGTPRKRMVDWSAINRIPLPRSPSSWELEANDSIEGATTESFELTDSKDWVISGIEKLGQAERPDTAYRLLYATGKGILAIDDLGKSVPGADAAAIRYGREGDIEAIGPLPHGIYRLGVSAMSGSFIGLSRTHIAHAYDEQLQLIFETDLAKSPEIEAIRRRLGIDQDELHTHIRSITLSDDAQRYLFTVVDEAWCVGANGTGIWGLSVPLNEGYTLKQDEPIGTQADVQLAIDTMGLSLPLTANDVKQRYRALAKEWHPDVNRSPNAGSRMQEINHAMSLLTGLDGSALAAYSGVRMAYKEMNSTTISGGGLNVTISMGIGMSEKSAADWIYASAFATNIGRAFIATYSGKVLEVDGSGKPIRYYEIGNVPRRIIDTGDYLYLLTDTRLYVLQNDALITLVDISKGGDIIVAQTGFGLIEKKRFRWFNEIGTHSGTVTSKDPLRRVYQKSGELIVETRTRRLRVTGTNPWWE